MEPNYDTVDKAEQLMKKVRDGETVSQEEADAAVTSSAAADTTTADTTAATDSAAGTDGTAQTGTADGSVQTEAAQ